MSSVRLVKGMAYVSMLKTKGNEFNVLFGQQKLQLPPSSHIRLQVDGTQATLAVLDGTVNIDGPEGPGVRFEKEHVDVPIAGPGGANRGEERRARSAGFLGQERRPAPWHRRVTLRLVHPIRTDRGHGVLRKLYERCRLRLDVASLLRQRCVGSVRQRVWAWYPARATPGSLRIRGDGLHFIPAVGRIAPAWAGDGSPVAHGTG